MKKMAIHKKTTTLLICAAAVLLLLTGCSTLDSKEQDASSAAPVAAVQPENAHVYLDFGDVMLPKELKVDKKESFVMNTGGTTSGVLVMSGGVDANSPCGFFRKEDAGGRLE